MYKHIYTQSSLSCYSFSSVSSYLPEGNSKLPLFSVLASLELTWPLTSLWKRVSLWRAKKIWAMINATSRGLIYCTSLTFPTINKTKSEIYKLFFDRSDVINTSLKWFQIHSEPSSSLIRELLSLIQYQRWKQATKTDIWIYSVILSCFLLNTGFYVNCSDFKLKSRL